MDRPVGTRSASPSSVEAGRKQERPKLTKVNRSKPSIPPVADRQRPTLARQAVARDEPVQTNRHSFSTTMSGRQQPEPFRLLPPTRSKSDRSSQTLTPPSVRRSVAPLPIERPIASNRPTVTPISNVVNRNDRPTAVSQVNRPAERPPTTAPNQLRQSSPAIPTPSSVSRPTPTSIPQGNDRERPQTRTSDESEKLTLPAAAPAAPPILDRPLPSKKLHELPSTLKPSRSRPTAALPERTVEKAESRSVPEIVVSRGTRPQPVAKPLQDRSTTGQYRSGELTPPGRVKPIGGQPPTRTTTGRTLRVGDL